MKRERLNPSFWSFIVFIVMLTSVITGCQTYERQVIPGKLPSTYPNTVEVSGATIAAKVFEDREEAEKAFGFDIRGAGILPLQLIFDNKGTSTLEVAPEGTFLIDKDGNVWPILDSSLAYERISKKTELGQIAPEAAKGGLLAGIAGAMIGAAVGIVSGTNVGEAAAKGAAVGAAAGATIGGIKGYMDRGVPDKIREDLRNKNLENKPISPNQIAFGILFFPGESSAAKELRLRIKEREKNSFQIVNINF
ncbi:MAG: glycine zipper domain-containing protein [Syntrophorhabdaceae bacterium]|nr:glycine zipper domain-containing protein [Syntrophorhabdaceae bacterium]